MYKRIRDQKQNDSSVTALGNIRQENMKELEYEEQSFTKLLKADKNIFLLFANSIKMKNYWKNISISKL